MKRILIILSIIAAGIISVPAQTYNLDSYIELIKKNNKDIIIASKDVKIAETQSDETKGYAYPHLETTIDYKRNLNPMYLYINLPEMGSGKFKMTKDNEFAVQTVLTQTLFNYTVFTAIKAAEEYEKLTDYTYQATVKGVLSGAKKAFYQTLLLKKVWEVKQETEKNALDNYNLVKNKFNNGLVSKLELLQSEVRWKNLIPETQLAERNYKLAINSLKSLTGIPVEQEMELTGSLETFPVRPESLDINYALKNRDDYNAMVWENNLRTTNIDVEYANHFPTVYASMVYRYSAQSDRISFEEENNAVIAGINVKIPIFNGMQTSAKVQRAKIEVEKSQLRINKFKEKIEIELKNLTLRFDEAQKRIISAEATKSIALQAYQIAESSSKNGLATQLELKDAAVLNEQAQLGYYAAVYDYLDTYFDWEFTTGMISM